MWNCNPFDFTLELNALVKRHQIVIPCALRERILQQVHIGHFGIVKMKNLAQGYCWWPNMNKDIENLFKNCYECNLHMINPPKSNLHNWEPTTSPFERVHLDFAGPFRGKMFFLYVDCYSKWPEVNIVRDITAETTIQKCQEIFPIFGLPENIIADNGRTFESSKFKDFC